MMARCHICNKKDGWGLTMLDWADNIKPICRVCYNGGCQNHGCEFPLFAHTNPACEIRFMDSMGEGMSDDSELFCKQCRDDASMKAEMMVEIALENEREERETGDNGGEKGE